MKESSLADEYRQVVAILDREISEAIKFGGAELLERLLKIRGEYRDKIIESMCERG